VRAAELGDGVVAVADEDPLVQLRGALALLGLRRARVLGQRVGELVEEQAAQRARVAGVAREERALHRLGQVDEREDGTVEVRDVRREARPLVGAEGLGGVLHGVPHPSPSRGRRRRPCGGA
jgi:hypothetical protein